MAEVDVFSWLVQYHIDTNLSPILASIYNGRAYSPQGEPAVEGEELGEWARGCLVIANGQTLADRLVEDKIILDHSAPRFSPAGTYAQFTEHLDRNIKKDGAFVYNGSHKSIARVAKLNNSTPALNEARKFQQGLIPPNFVYEHNTTPFTLEDIDEHIGTKTDLAMLTPLAYTLPNSHVHSYQIKRTAYGQLGLGKVTHFGREGLVEELFFKYSASSTGPFIEEEQGIIGVHRMYENVNGKVTLKSVALWDAGHSEELRYAG